MRYDSLEDNKEIDDIEQISMDMAKQVSEDNSQVIKDVWLHDFFENMDKIAKLVDEYNYIAMVSHIVLSTFLFLTFNFLVVGYRVSRFCICATQC